MTALRDALAEAEKRAVDAEQCAAVAEAVAAERERLIEAHAMALRLLELPSLRPSTLTTDLTTNPR